MMPTILAVDDNQIHSYALVKTLELAGFHVVFAATGTQALAMAKEHKPDAIVLDINLPDVSGFEVCLRIKSAPETCDIPVIFHTASSAGAARGHAEIVGGSAFLTYPIDAEHLITVVRGSLIRAAGKGA
ncbi:MAG TPA: response regulator [Candidatus Angelobacter sp.]|nr:response regulator [Candidatus Angelobacter sp.]